MKLRYTNNKRAEINTKEYILEAIKEFGKDVLQILFSPSERWLFTVGKVRKMQGRRLDKFYSVFMKLLWILQRGRPDFTTDISYLCTRMNQPKIEYWKKFKRVLCFMNMKINDERIIVTKNLHEM